MSLQGIPFWCRINTIALSKSFIMNIYCFFFPSCHRAREFEISTVKKICSNIGLRHSLSLSNFFNSDNESLNLVFQYRKSFTETTIKGWRFLIMLFYLCETSRRKDITPILIKMQVCQKYRMIKDKKSKTAEIYI